MLGELNGKRVEEIKFYVFEYNEVFLCYLLLYCISLKIFVFNYENMLTAVLDTLLIFPNIYYHYL